MMKKLIAVMTRIISNAKGSYWLTSGFYSLLSKIVTVLFGFVNFFILIRLLPKGDYGAWVLFFSVSSLIELLKHGFIRNPLIRYLSISTKEDGAKLQTASILLNFTVTAIQIALLFLFANALSQFWNVEQLKPLFLIYIFTTISLIPSDHFQIVQQAGLQFKEYFLSTVVKQGGFFVFVIGSYFFGWTIDLNSLAIAQAVSIALSCILSYIQSHRLLHFGALERKWILELFHYGKFTFGTNVSSMIIKNIDSWMLGKMISPQAVAIFNPTIRLSNLVEIPNDTLTTIYFPKLSKDMAAHGTTSIKYYYEKAVGTVLGIIIPVVIFVIIFAKPVILFIAGPGFEEAVPVLQITMLYGLLIPFNRFFGVTLDAIGKARMNFIIVLAMAVLNIVNNLLFIRHFGMIGAAYGTLTTYIITVTCNQIFLYRKFGITIASIASYAWMFYYDMIARMGEKKPLNDVK
jgi:lipopolysaccharide exporter